MDVGILGDFISSHVIGQAGMVNIKYCSLVMAVMITAGLSHAMNATDISYLGGENREDVSCAAKAGEDTYVALRLYSTTMPFPVEGYQSVGDYGYGNTFADGMVVRLDGTGVPTAATYVSGNFDDEIKAILALSDGVVVVLLTSSTDLQGSFPNAPPPDVLVENVLIVKYSLDLTQVLWSYAIAGQGWDQINDIALCGDRLILVGSSDSHDLPASNPIPDPLRMNGVILALDPMTGFAESFRFLFAASIGRVVSLPDAGYLISGHTAIGLPVSDGVFDTVTSSWSEGYIARFAADDSLVWLTYAGGEATDTGSALAYDPASDTIYAGMKTNSPDLPVTPHADGAAYAGGYDIYCFALGGDAGALYWGRYFGLNSPTYDGGYVPTMRIDERGTPIMASPVFSLAAPVGESPPFDPLDSVYEHTYAAILDPGTGSVLDGTYLPGSQASLGDILLRNHALELYVSYSACDGCVVIEPTPDAFDTVIEGGSEGAIIRLETDLIVGVEDPGTVSPTRHVGEGLAISADATNLYLASAAFSAPLARVDVYDLKGRRLLTRRSLLSDTDHGPAHVLPREALGRIAGGTYVVAVTCEDRRISGAVSLRR